MWESIFNTAMEWLKNQMYLPLFILALGVFGYFILNYVIKSSSKREQYLIDVLNKKEAESKEDKANYLKTLDLYHKGIHDITSTIEKMNTTFSTRFDYIEKIIDIKK